MLRFLQKRKFRLVTRWKAALKDNVGFQMPSQQHFPYTLIFRAFDEILRLLKAPTTKHPVYHQESILAGLDTEEIPTADQYMELFLTGRDVLGEFVETDRAFCGLFEKADRQELRTALETAIKDTIDDEMREYARRNSTLTPNRG